MPASRIVMKSLAVVVVVAAGVSAFAKGPAEVTPYPPDWPHGAPWKLNRSLLLPDADRIVFIVDAPRGAPPAPEALDHLASLAAKYSGRPASWVTLGEPGAPAVRWVEPSGPTRPLKYYVYLSDGQTPDSFHMPGDDRDTLRYLAEVPSCPSGALSAGIAYVFVRYLGYIGSGYGSSRKVASDASCGGLEFPVLKIAQTKIAEARAPGLGQAFLEKRALAHEYGHALGLGSNPAHGRWSYTLPYRGGAHCIHRECAVAVATAMAVLKGRMLDYCDACRRDIEQAREHWRAGTTFEESPRLPQPDAAAEVTRLKNYNFCDGCEADRLQRIGKPVMPALIDRMGQLPGGTVTSPRAYAAQLALKIIADEDELRKPPGAPALAVPASGDASALVLEWWQDQSERFMAGDDWSSP